ncbi:hypothetical protein [Ekhidna sp. To15]|uniref:hypothetical protein n=1 Tax=Ekhidna sp. To15 TaxID=3395267 RepID=UPI003F51D08C
MSTLQFGLAKTLVTAITLVSMSIVTVPLVVGNDLTNYVKQDVEPFELVDHEGNKTSSDQLMGKIVVPEFPAL